jgi:replicative DNA helicase
MKNLLTNEEYTRKVLPYLKAEYFLDPSEKFLFNCINEYIDQYNNLPSVEALSVIVNDSTVTDNILEETNVIVSSINTLESDFDLEWLYDTTEEFCQDKAIYNTIMESVNIIEGKHDLFTKNHIPEMMSDAISISFDVNVGHDYIEDSDQRFDFYHMKEDKIPFDLEYLNKITKGGLSKKSLNIILAGTGVGKSLFMCHCAASNLSLGKKVLYITLEMAEERIAERIDANLLNVSMEDLHDIAKIMYNSKMEKVRTRTEGKLIIKEYPTASANTTHFQALLKELKIKRQFVPDIVYIDYLNICSSSRMKQTANVNSYTYIKAIAEEMRGLAVEHNIPIMSATQTTRTGFSNDDLDLTDTSESFGLPATADFMIGITSNEQLEEANQMMVKQLKNRYNDPTIHRRFVVGVDKSKMRLYDLEESAQSTLINNVINKNILHETAYEEKNDEEVYKQHKHALKF